MKKISNPLTIIGLFASIAEVAGTVVLSKMTVELQRIFIWYVMLFPVFLVVAFFFTLIKYPDNLYSPSDFANEENYLKIRLQQKAAVEKISNKIDEIKMKQDSIEVVQALQAVQDTLSEVKNSNNASTDRALLAIITAHENGISAFELASELGVSKAFVYRKLERLVNDGLLMRSQGNEKVNGTTRQINRYKAVEQEN